MKWSREAARWTLSRIYQLYFCCTPLVFWMSKHLIPRLFFKKGTFYYIFKLNFIILCGKYLQSFNRWQAEIKAWISCASILQQSRWFACDFIYMKISILSLRQESALFFSTFMGTHSVYIRLHRICRCEKGQQHLHKLACTKIELNFPLSSIDSIASDRCRNPSYMHEKTRFFSFLKILWLCVIWKKT